MNFENLKTFVTGTAGKVGFWFKKNSSEILLVGGLIGVGATVVLACIETTKLEKTLEPTNKNLKKLKEELNDDNKVANGIVDPNIVKKEITKEYGKAVLNVAKLYAPAAGVLASSVAMILFSHKIIKGREVAAIAAYSSLNETFKKYRNEMKNVLGEEKEQESFINATKEENTYNEEGNKINIDKGKDDIYSYLFDERHPCWVKNGKVNLDYLLMTEKFLNEKFRAQGYLFLSDVYKNLNIDNRTLSNRTIQASHVLGWIYDPEDHTRDNYISFGLSDCHGNLNRNAMDMLRNGERNIWLTFNPDGDILTGDNKQKTFMEYAKD